MVAMNKSNEGKENLCAEAGEVYYLVYSSALIGFTLGLILAVLAGSRVWLEMRLNMGHLIPVVTVLCPVLTLWKGSAFSYAVFLMEQVVLLIILLAIYGFDAGALCSVPAYLFREGFHGNSLSLTTARVMVCGIFLGGNLLWIYHGINQLYFRRKK